MTLAPTETELRARARVDLRQGLPIVLTGGPGPVLVAAVETLGKARLAALHELGGEAQLAITLRRAETLRARPYSDAVARIRLPAEAPLSWLLAVADPASDLMTPMKGPFDTLRGGDEAAAIAAIELAKEARLLPAVVVLPVPDAPEGLTRLPLRPPGPSAPHLHPVAGARLPIAMAEGARLHVFRPDDGTEEHYAIEIGRPDRSAPVLSRLHSACFTGDVLGSLKCDCGPQLRSALAQMGEEGEGVLLYLNQEGRGIGLANKMRAYSLQDQGFDTVEANHRLGFEDDERDFRIGAEILRQMGFSRVRLMTNNPAKVERLGACGLEVVERVPLKVGETVQNRAYLATKARKSGHLL